MRKTSNSNSTSSYTALGANTSPTAPSLSADKPSETTAVVAYVQPCDGRDSLIRFIADLAILQLAEETRNPSLLTLISPESPVGGLYK
jgi:hypothetical protein